MPDMHLSAEMNKMATSELDRKWRPVIGISVSVDDDAQDSLLDGTPICYVSRAMIAAIEHAGGLPVMVPPTSIATMRDTIARLDGLVMTGALRPLPSTIRNMHPLPGLKLQNPNRYRYDAALVELALATNLPIMGICRGMQMLNEITGGSLLDQVQNPELHRSIPGNPPTTHQIELVHGSKLHDIVQEDVVSVNSYHVQAVDKVGTGMRISARTPDGTVEGIEATEARFVLGLQFHPELMQDSNVSRQLFQSLIDAAFTYHPVRQGYV